MDNSPEPAHDASASRCESHRPVLNSSSPADRNEKGANPAAHRRTISASSLLSRLPFLRLSVDENTDSKPTPSPKPQETASAAAVVTVESWKQQLDENTAPTPVPLMRSPTTRNRKGSLRKTALLGTGRLKRIPPPNGQIVVESGSDRQRGQPQTSSRGSSSDVYAYYQNEDGHIAGTTRGSEYFGHKGGISVKDNPSQAFEGMSTESLGQKMTVADPTFLSVDTRERRTDTSPPSTATSPIASSRYVSTTSEDDNPLLHASTTTTTARRPVPSLPTILSASLTPAPDPTHSYESTASWGWVILLATWLTFVIGMGSCLEVWSWAWDVGETPYAPPELEDDPTLPIVGYYPALIVMTGVMAWVWVVVAWVGMKYFRHAKVWEGDEQT